MNFKLVLGKALLLLLLLTPIFVIPATASAQFFAPGGGIVPCGNSPDDPCSLCDFVQLGENILNFLIYAGIIVSSLLFAYAGILLVLYSTNPGNKEKAKSIFTNVVIGFIILLAAWALVNIFLSVLTGNGLRFWETKICLNVPTSEGGRVRGGSGSPTVTVESTPSGTPSYEPPTVAEMIAHSDEIIAAREAAAAKAEIETGLREVFSDQNVSVNKGACGVGESFHEHSGGCTDISGLDASTLRSISYVADTCTTTTGGQCNLRIAGGSELGHAGEDSSHSTCLAESGAHCAGDKYDLSTTEAALLTNYVRDGRNGFVEADEPTFGIRQYTRTVTLGADSWTEIWTYEDALHFDVEVID